MRHKFVKVEVAKEDDCEDVLVDSISEHCDTLEEQIDVEKISYNGWRVGPVPHLVRSRAPL